MSRQNDWQSGIAGEEPSAPGTISLDREKLKHIVQSSVNEGYDNFIIYQQTPDFRWPAWLSRKLSGEFPTGGTPPLLSNDCMRERVPFSNLLSREELHIDPTGLVSPSYDRWSLELWVLAGKNLYLPAQCSQQIVQRRDPQSVITETRWEDKGFILRQQMIGARSDVDEAIMTVEVTLKAGTDTMLLLCVRPYNMETLGGISRVEYTQQGGVIQINGKKLICSPRDPDFVLAGRNDRDIDLADEGDTLVSKSGAGMATLALGYMLKKGENSLHCRISLSPRGLAGGKYDLAALKEEFTNFTGLRLKQGASLVHSDRDYQRWFSACKMNTLMYTARDYRKGSDPSREMDFRFMYFAASGFNRMGYFKESQDLIQHFADNYPSGVKKPSLSHIINGCYLLCAYADIFTHVREVEYLQSRFESIKAIAGAVYRASSKLKGPFPVEGNTIDEYCLREGHPLDAVIIADAMDRFSYLARCLGIFGEEIKYKKESDRLHSMLREAVKPGGAYDTGRANYAFYLMHFLYPHRMPPMGESVDLADALMRRYGGLPLCVNPFGWDIVNTLVSVNALIHLGDQGVYPALEKLMQLSGERYCFPAYVNPATRCGSFGPGVSKIAGALMFSTIRFLLFIDYPERLDLFPVPHREWFKPGVEIHATGLPSRFGQIDFRMVATSNEIQIFFDRLPKFIPPEIAIHLPFKAKIHEGDDFIVKREDESSFVINGWPSVVRFVRKQQTNL